MKIKSFRLVSSRNRIDILQSLDGISFESAWTNRVQARIDGELIVPFISRADLITNKEHTGRTRDLADAEDLREVDKVLRAARQTASTGGIELLRASNDPGADSA